MSGRPDGRQILRSEVQSSLSRLSQVEGQLSWLSSSIAYIDSMCTSLPSRFESLRKGGFVHRVSVEMQLKKLVDNWNLTRAGITSEIESLTSQLRSEISALKMEGNSLLNRINQPFLVEFAVRGEVTLYNSKVNSFVSRANIQINQAKQGLGEVKENFEKVEKVVVDAENVLSVISSASFPLQENEHPLLSVKAKKLEPGEKCEGRIILTDQRLLFEVEREVVLERKLFIATKTKTERSLDLDVPLGLIASAQKGRVGLIAWEGVYVDLRPGYKFKAVVFDTKGDDTEKVVEAINYVLSGQADKDRTVLEVKPVEEPKAFFCIKCGAPLYVPTTRGIYEVECKYCGTRNRIK
jgi:DNA-directed RNA polymerase subunit RPC12/RpoP